MVLPFGREKVDIDTRSLKIDRHHAGELLARLYERYHRPEYIHPDPLELVLRAEPHDREVTALIASSLALGRVDLILEAAGSVLGALGSPAAALASLSPREVRSLFVRFRYRFFSGEQLANLLIAVGRALRRFGSLEACFRDGLSPGDVNTLSALTRFVHRMRQFAEGDIGILLSDPAKGSASKRLNLFLRWMVRRDAIDPGGWDLPPRLLLVPADVHMIRVSRMLGFTERKQPDLRAAIEITSSLSLLCAEDPVKYDFSMTRLGIHPALTYANLYASDAG